MNNFLSPVHGIFLTTQKYFLFPENIIENKHVHICCNTGLKTASLWDY